MSQKKHHPRCLGYVCTCSAIEGAKTAPKPEISVGGQSVPLTGRVILRKPDGTRFIRQAVAS